jgi:hypothetical protein
VNVEWFALFSTIMDIITVAPIVKVIMQDCLCLGLEKFENKLGCCARFQCLCGYIIIINTKVAPTVKTKTCRIGSLYVWGILKSLDIVRI